MNHQPPKQPLFETIILVTGFLGSGKTTFINHLLQQKPPFLIGLIINDFGQHNIDIELLRSASNGRPAYPVSNGCICCSAKNGLSQAAKALWDQNVQNLIIEASGLFFGDDCSEIAALCKKLIVICLVDSRHILQNKPLSIEAKSQIKAADIMILSYVDQLDGLSMFETQSKASIYNQNATLLSGNDVDIWDKILSAPVRQTALTSKHKPHFHSDIMAIDISVPPLHDQPMLEYLIYILSWPSIGKVIRAKGIIYIESTPHLLQLTNDTYQTTPLNPEQTPKAFVGILSVFGYQLQQDMLNSAIQQIK